MSLHLLYWTIIFMQGVFRLLELPSYIYKVGIPLIGVLIFLDVLHYTKTELKVPYIKTVVVFVIISILSSVINNIDTILFIYFIIYTLLSYLYFIAVINDIEKEKYEVINKYLVFLILLQIPAVFFKYALIGISESGAIGTLCIKAGSVSTIFPMIISAILFSYYLKYRNIKYVVLIVFFLLFGLIGKKRAILIFIPITLLVVLFIKQFKADKQLYQNGGRSIIFTVIFGVMIFYLTARLAPSLNPDNKVWGNFNLTYITNYITTYTSSSGNDFQEMRRIRGFTYFTNYILYSNWLKLLIGEGAGKLILSSFREQSGDMLSLYGIRYGGRMGFIWLLLQVGFLGILVYLSLFIRMFRFVWNNYKDEPLYLSFLALTVVFFIDTFTYSRVFIRYEFLSGLYFYIFAVIYLDLKQNEDLKDVEIHSSE